MDERTVKPDSKKIKELRQELGWSEEHLAEVTGLSVETIWDIESGKSVVPTTLGAVAATFKVTLKQITISTEAYQTKLVAIFYADVVGYSRLTEQDEIDTHHVLSGYLDLMTVTIENYSGNVVHFAGDAILAEFGTVSNALGCAVSVQQELATRNNPLPENSRVQFRIGINLGDVIVDRNDIYGHGVNVAARLEGLADPGGICISDAVRLAVGTKLPLEYEFMGEQQTKNIAEPVRAYRVLLEEGTPSKQCIEQATKIELADKPSIAVLPFTNMSGDPEQEYFSDGLTEDIITELSRFHTLFVIARHSSFTFKGRAVDIKEVGEKLGVRYVVEGSVRKAGKRVRVSAQLVEAASANHIWAERYDRDMEDIFAIQDDVTRSIVSTLTDRLDKAVADQAERKPTENLTAYDYMLRGKMHFHRASRKDNAKARQFYQKAIALDPGFAQAHARLAATHNTDAFMGWETIDTWEETMAGVQQALSLDNNDSFARLVLGFTLLRRCLWDDAEEQFKRAIDANPNDAETRAWAARGFLIIGRQEKALDLIVEATRLNPLPPEFYPWTLGVAFYLSGRYTEAVRALRQVRQRHAWVHAYLAAAYAQMGRKEDACSEAKAYIDIRRKKLGACGDSVPADDRYLNVSQFKFHRRQSDRNHMLDGLRKAGLVE